MSEYLLAIDQGTSSSRAFIFSTDGNIIAKSQQDIACHYPHSGWVEQDPNELWKATCSVVEKALSQASLTADNIHACGITNQRETIVLWDARNGEAIHPAIVWQDRRTHSYCKELAASDSAKSIKEKTGLVIDPYFSATKIKWILNNVPEAALLAKQGHLRCGTVDTYLMWRFSQGTAHVTDITNASRTQLMNLKTGQWDHELLKLFEIPEHALPTILDCDSHFAEIAPDHFGAPIPITGVAGDQHAALLGQACFTAGMMKITFGTGAFLLLNTGEECVQSDNGLLSTIAFRIKDKTYYGLEGSIFNAGTIVKWLRDELGLITSAAETETIAMQLNDSAGIHLVPAFTGLGAPHWDPEARAAILGISRNSKKEHIVRAGLEAIAYQTNDVMHCMRESSIPSISHLRVDGGMAVNNWLLQFLADILQTPVERPYTTETTVLGAAYLAALGSGLFNDINEVKTKWRTDQRFTVKMNPVEQEVHYSAWQKAVRRVLL